MQILCRFYAHMHINMKKELNSLKNDLKLSFSKAKEHISSLENEILALKEEIKGIKEGITPKNSQKTEEITPQEQSSIGNKGVYSFNHSFTQSFNHSTETQELLSRITKQELLILLTIAQLEEEIVNITYADIANKLKLSQGCIRGYITSLIRKGTPIYKEKYNNKITLIRLSPQFKSLNKQSLIDSFYKIDPYQKKL